MNKEHLWFAISTEETDAIGSESGSPLSIMHCQSALRQAASEKCWCEHTLQYFFHTDCKYNLGINHQK